MHPRVGLATHGFMAFSNDLGQLVFCHMCELHL